VSHYEELEDDSSVQISKKTLNRIFALLKPHWKTVIVFLGAIIMVSAMDAYFTYLSKQIIDVGIEMKNKPELIRYISIYGSIVLLQ